MNVEMALDRARTAGPNSVLKYSTQLRFELLEEMQLEQDLRAAIEAEAIKPFYQPQFDLNTGKVIGMEALARWQRDDGITRLDARPVEDEVADAVGHVGMHTGHLMVAGGRDDEDTAVRQVVQRVVHRGVEAAAE